ncbi:MAG: DUF4105 domain-containing protein [Pseudomonadota bacterium]
MTTAPDADAIADAAGDPVWRKLVRYVRPPLGRGDGHSDVVTDAFFLSERKPFDATAELRATVRALSAPAGAPDAHAACRFPARARFAKARLGVAPPADVQCPALEAWRRGGAVTGVSVIFASGHLSNPGSFYGHLLLKFNDGAAGLSDDLLDTTLNYGAIFPERENPVAYILKGVAGGYVSQFTHLNYYHHTHNYAETQLRDVWEYELDLDQGAVDLLVDHTWEMLGVGNRYYFMRQNCAYRVAELIELVTTEPLLPRSKAWSTPIDVFDRLSRTERNGRPLVRSVRRLPSRQNRFRETYRALPSADRRTARRVIDDPSRAAALAAASPVDDNAVGGGGSAAARIIETALDYYAFASAKDEASEPALRRPYNDLLLARLSLPPSREDSGVRADGAETPPHEGHKSSLIQLRPLYNSAFGEGVEIRFRPAYSDFFSLRAGALPYSELSILDARVLVANDDVTLRRLDVVRVTTLNPSETGLKYDGGKAWRFRLGAEARELACEGCTTGFLDVALGKARAVSRLGAVYAMGAARVRVGANNDSYLQVGPNVGFVSSDIGGVVVAVEGGAWREADGPETSAYARVEARLGAATRWDVRLKAEYETGVAAAGAAEGGLAISFFW